MSESTVFGVGLWMSIRRLCVRTSKCSRESLSMKGPRITQYTFFSVGSGTGPVIVAPVRWAVSTIWVAEPRIARCGRVVALGHERVDRLRRGAVDVDEALVRAHLEVLTRVLVLERAADHAVDVLLGRQRDGTGDGRAGALRRLHDLGRRAVHLLVVVALQTDADLLLRHVREKGGASCLAPTP